MSAPNSLSKVLFYLTVKDLIVGYYYFIQQKTDKTIISDRFCCLLMQ